MHHLGLLAGILISAIALLAAVCGIVAHVLAPTRSKKGIFWEIAGALLVVALVVRSTLLLEPPFAWQLPVANGCMTVAITLIWIGCRHINGHDVRLMILGAVLLGALVGGVTWGAVLVGRPTDASLPTVLLMSAIAVASACECLRGRLSRLRQARTLAVALFVGAATLPLGASTTFAAVEARSFDTVEQILYPLIALTILPIGGFSLLALQIELGRRERETRDTVSHHIYMEAGVFRRASAEAAAHHPHASLTVILLRAPSPALLLDACRSIATELAPTALIGAFRPNILIVASDLAPDVATRRTRHILQKYPGLITAIDSVEYSETLNEQLTTAFPHGADSRVQV